MDEGLRLRLGSARGRSQRHLLLCNLVKYPALWENMSVKSHALKQTPEEQKI